MFFNHEKYEKNRVFLILVSLGILFLLFSSKNKADRQQAPLESTFVNAQPSLPNQAQVGLTQPTPQQSAQTPTELTKTARVTQLSPDEIEALRSQTKSFLAALYTSQKAFHAEYNQYVTDIVAIGLTPDPILPFKAGFLESSEEPLEVAADTKIDSRRLSTDSIIGDKHSITNEPFEYAPHVRDIDLHKYRDLCSNGCTANKDTFEMLVATPLGNSDQIDIWILNERKEFLLVKDGTKSQVE